MSQKQIFKATDQAKHGEKDPDFSVIIYVLGQKHPLTSERENR